MKIVIITKNSMALMHYFYSNDLVKMKNITIQIPDNELANGFLKEFSKEQRLKHQHYIMKLKKVCLYRTDWSCIGRTSR